MPTVFELVAITLAGVNLIGLLALARIVGAMQLRIPPSGARQMVESLVLGDEAPAVEHLRAHFENVRSRLRMLAFVSPNCETCEALMRPLRSFSEGENIAALVVAQEEDSSSIVQQRAQSLGLPVVIDRGLVLAFGVGVTPYCVVLDQEYRVVAHGLANTMEHLESLLSGQLVGRDPLLTGTGAV
jgi:methylamine dehydrogenase accessory protein MauD